MTIDAIPDFSNTEISANRSSEPLTGQLAAGTRMPVRIFEFSDEVAHYVAGEVARLVRQRNASNQRTVLGLPTGSTPVGVYRELIRMHREEGLDLSHCVTFNLDEYWPMDPQSIHSYRRWMRENFFDHVNIPESQIHIPHGDVPRQQIETMCRDYELQIQQAGGIDLQLLGIGRTGHVGFNEPGSAANSRTRLITLDPVTRKDAASGFYGEEHVPLRAVTMGVGTIRDARRVLILALGEHKASVVRKSVEEAPCEEIVASLLQSHPAAEFVADAAAAARLTDVRSPWLHRRLDWTPELEKRAVIWLCQQTGKPISKLESRDFAEHHLADLLHETGPLKQVRSRVFNSLSETICMQPAGDTPQTVIVFSPHPDDDVISMGGTLITLAEQGHNVHIAYMTSGNIAVFDHDALRHVDYVSEFLELFGVNSPEIILLEQQIRQLVAHKQPGAPDAAEVLKVKGLIRKTEAVSAALTAGVPEANCHFLDMPFYQTGLVRKNPVGHADVTAVTALLRQLQPQQVYLAGDLSDPHGTHRMCAEAIIAALPIAAEEGIAPEVWLYRGAWQEYEPHEIERAVPLSPETMSRKKQAIFKHESQKDAALFPGHDEREFWVRAEERTKHTARIFNELGLPEFFALESFRRLREKL
ncbi:MAG: glucosamine-6-phosphate deaminase [Planctomycetaceae bacterium]|nr:glucosamine-6-phosphate deaminase [Planctomycetaceae bacterium]